MRFQIEFSLDNEAFATQQPSYFDGYAIAEVLGRICSHVRSSDCVRHGDGRSVFDINGNRIGEWRVATDASAEA